VAVLLRNEWPFSPEYATRPHPRTENFRKTAGLFEQQALKGSPLYLSNRFLTDWNEFFGCAVVAGFSLRKHMYLSIFFLWKKGKGISEWVERPAVGAGPFLRTGLICRSNLSLRCNAHSSGIKAWGDGRGEWSASAMPIDSSDALPILKTPHRPPLFSSSWCKFFHLYWKMHFFFNMLFSDSIDCRADNPSNLLQTGENRNDLPELACMFWRLHARIAAVYLRSETSLCELNKNGFNL